MVLQSPRSSVLACTLTSLIAVPSTCNSIRLREALLCEAHVRLRDWYADKASLGAPYERDGVVLHLRKEESDCGGDDVPVTFGEFDVTGARPIDVFQALADPSEEKKWNPTVSDSQKVAEVREEGVRGLVQTYPSGIPFVPDRQVFQWQAFSRSASEEYWFATTTLWNEHLHAVMPMKDGAVEATNCLGAYHIRPSVASEDGQPVTHVTFTQHVNVHPFLVSSKLVFKVSWGKQVDFINALRGRAQWIAGRRETSADSVFEGMVPSVLVHDDEAFPGCFASLAPPKVLRFGGNDGPKLASVASGDGAAGACNATSWWFPSPRQLANGGHLLIITGIALCLIVVAEALRSQGSCRMNERLMRLVIGRDGECRSWRSELATMSARRASEVPLVFQPLAAQAPAPTSPPTPSADDFGAHSCSPSVSVAAARGDDDADVRLSGS